MFFYIISNVLKQIKQYNKLIVKTKNQILLNYYEVIITVLNSEWSE